jgi:hypothetical protein
VLGNDVHVTYLKYGPPVASSMALLAWSPVEFGQGYEQVGGSYFSVWLWRVSHSGLALPAAATAAGRRPSMTWQIPLGYIKYHPSALKKPQISGVYP